MKAIQKIIHDIKMVCSKRYATNYQVAEALTGLQQEIDLCSHRTANMRLIQSLVQTIRNLDRGRLSEAIELLVEANNFDCKACAIELDSSNGCVCADQLMETARDNLRLFGHSDHATWARKRLILAKEWYLVSGTLTRSLAEEIDAGLDQTKWVLTM